MTKVANVVQTGSGRAERVSRFIESVRQEVENWRRKKGDNLDRLVLWRMEEKGEGGV